MKVTVERKPQSAVSLDIVADEDEFNRALDKAFRKINQQVRIPGFRPGKAPRAIVEQRFGREMIVHEAHHEIMDTLYRQALDQESIVPVSEAEVDVYQDEPIGFRVDVQVYPTIELGDYTGIRLESREVSVTDEDVDEVIENIRLNNSVWLEPAEPRKPIDGDQVIVDLQAFEGEEPFQEPVENATFNIGDASLFPQIEEALRELMPGESSEFDISFEEEDERANPDLRGKTLHYKVTLKEVKERELPEIDDELAKSTGEFETLEELRATVRRDLLRSRAMEARSEVVNEAVEKLAEIATFELPPAMIDRQVEDDIQRLSQQLQREQMSFDEFLRFGNKTLDEYKEEARPDAEKRLRNSIVLEEFSKAENIEVTENDLMEEIDRITGPAENAQQMREIYSSPYFQRMIMDELANRKLTDHLIDLVTEGRGAVTGEGAEALKQDAVTATTTEVTGESETEVEDAEADTPELEVDINVPAAESDQADTADESVPEHEQPVGEAESEPAPEGESAEVKP